MATSKVFFWHHSIGDDAHTPCAPQRLILRTAALGMALCSLAICAPQALNAQAADSPRATVVFWQPGFPTIESLPIPEQTLRSALGADAQFVGLDKLRTGAPLTHARLLVLPNGSALPAAAWPAIEAYLKHGGNLLLLGGQPFRVPVLGDAPGAFQQEAAQDSYSLALGIRHSYAVPMVSAAAHFAWRNGYSFLPAVAVHASTVFAEEGRLDGLGYLEATDGTKMAAPVIVADDPGGSMPDTRVVALPIDPEPGYWSSPDGVRLIGAAAGYAAAGPTRFSIELEYSALRPGEVPQITLHLHRPAGAPSASSGQASEAKVAMYLGDKQVDEATIPLNGASADAPVPFNKPLAAGVYTLRATWTPAGAGAPQEFAENGIEVEQLSALETGPALGTHGDFLSLGGKPFFPVGTNYFTTEENGWDFSGPRNAAVWEHDFADMQRHNVSFVRTGVWMANGKFVDPSTGEVNERFLRNLEAYLAAAHHHGIAVNFTCFAFSPHVGARQGGGPGRREDTPDAKPLPNPYIDPAAVSAEHTFVVSIVHRFGKVPWLSWDLINEPSFSNPHLIFHGNVPNGDPVELHAWQAWLQQRYGTLAALADAWRVMPESLGDWSSIPLPKERDLSYSRNTDPDEVRAFDYNLFAQAMFSGWVHGIVEAIRSAGSTQLINVGQDEGGVTDRVLNQFYATAGVSFTTDHTYWQDDALLWDSVAAKRPGLPNITGETGYQPAWNPDGSWRYDELTGTDITERKWALGFADGSSGAMQWDWAREVDFGMERSDGSAKVWENMMRGLGEFAKQAEPYATGLTPPQVAIVLPQSLQLSVLNAQALQAQKTAVRVLYQYDRAAAYAVGSYQTDTLGAPKLILLPSAYGLNPKAWSDIEARVRAGAVLLISGPFSEDEHLHETDRAKQLGLDATIVPLQLRDDTLHFPGGDEPLEYPGMDTTMLDRAALSGGKDWAEVSLGAGKVLFSAYPLELNSNPESVAAVYAYALKLAHVDPVYTTPVKNPGILICPTVLPHATLYVLTSETATSPVSFTDVRSGKTFSGSLGAGRAALLLVDEKGDLQASYDWGDNRVTTP
jgi:hypothetical protein